MSVEEKRWSWGIKSEYIVNLPHTHDITSSNNEHYTIVVRKDSMEGLLILRIIHEVNPLIFSG